MIVPDSYLPYGGILNTQILSQKIFISKNNKRRKGKKSEIISDKTIHHTRSFLLIYCMARTKVTSRTMGITTSPNQGYHLKSSISSDALSSNTDFNNQYSCASSQASTQEAVFEENDLYRLDFSCPYCTNWSYVIGEHFCDNRYIVTYDFYQATALEYVAAVEYTPSMTEGEHTPVQQQEAPPPPQLPSSPTMEQKVFHTPPTKTSAEMFSEYSKDPRSNIKIAHREMKPKRRLFDKYDVDEHYYNNNNEEMHCHEEEKEKTTQRFSKRIKKAPRRYIEAV